MRDNTVNLIRNVLSVLEINNIQIVELSDGIQLLNTIIMDKNDQIVYIFTDENMEYLNGSEAVKIIRKLEQNHKINKYPIASITAFEDDETRKNILNSGVNFILSKPCTKLDITNILQKLIER